ncbi:PAS domain S-box protein [Thermithiobacillus plumbiphilus]|uniref:histidine kinase n=1 Tax=Thermithiobacillus plumbiphilus TaxID=1729899 RepID=A0ABU9DBD2_9PROT
MIFRVQEHRTRWLDYLLAVLLILLAIIINSFVGSLLTPNTLLSSFLAGVILSALLGGWKPGLLALAGSLVALNLYFFPTFGFFEVRELLARSASFTATSLLIIWLAHRLRRALTASQRDKRQHAFLSRTSAVLTEALDVESGMRDFCRLAVEQLCDWCVIGLAGSEKPRFVVGHRGADAAVAREIEAGLQASAQDFYIEHQRMASGQPVLIERFDAEQFDRKQTGAGLSPLVQKLRPRSYLGIPLLARGRLIGTLCFFRTESRVPFETKDLGIAEDLGKRLALILDNLQLYDQARQTEQSLRISEARFRAIFHQAAIGMTLADLDSNLLQYNNRFCEMMGYTAAEMQQMTFRDFTHPEDLPRELALRARMLKGEIPSYQLEKRYLRKGGEIMWGRVTVSMVRDADGNASYTMALVEDITEYKNAEAAMRAEHLLREKIMENASNAIFAVDESGCFLMLNPAMEEMTGYSRQELMKAPFTLMFDDGAQLRAKALFQQVLKGGRVLRQELVIQRKGGTHRHVIFSAAPVMDRDRIASIITAEDITERKLAEDAIRQMNATLEQRVAERTADLESFSYSVSHDLRAPLRAIDGFSLVVLEDFGECLGEEGAAYLRRVRAASQHMGHVIDTMLNLARLGRQALQPRSLNLSAMAQKILDRLQRCEPARKLEWRIMEGVYGQGDPDMIGLVLENLIGNAWKFTRQQPRPCIEFGTIEVQGMRAYFVRDNGAGFDMQFINKLFEPFHRLHGKEEFEGSGVGLATVQRIIHRHGGEIWAEGAVGQGATFYFTLPEAADARQSS